VTGKASLVRFLSAVLIRICGVECQTQGAGLVPGDNLETTGNYRCKKTKIGYAGWQGKNTNMGRPLGILFTVLAVAIICALLVAGSDGSTLKGTGMCAKC